MDGPMMFDSRLMDVYQFHLIPAEGHKREIYRSGSYFWIFQTWDALTIENRHSARCRRTNDRARTFGIHPWHPAG